MPNLLKTLSVALSLLPFLTAAVPEVSTPAALYIPPHQASTCAGTPLSCQPSPFTTIFVTSGEVVITKTITTIVTTSYSTTVTLPTTVGLPHSCFTYLIPTPQSDNAFCGPFRLKCPPVGKCTVTSTTTGPCKDPCCTCTPVVPTLGGCKTTCDSCTTSWKTVAQTKGCK